MPERFRRTELLLGAAALARLRRATVVVVGLGAVGGYATEALARAGIGRLRLVDHDSIRQSNRNRQLLALASTEGASKVEVARARVLDIAPDCGVEALPLFCHAETLDPILAGPPAAVVDAIDSFAPKAELISAALARGIPIWSSMGAASRTDPSRIRSGDLFSVRECPLARMLRKRLRREGLRRGVPCVYSLEHPAVPGPEAEANPIPRGRSRRPLGSLPTLPGIFGLWLANEVLMAIANGGGRKPPDGHA